VKPVTVPFFISHRGCPHTCVFCDQRAISGASGDFPTAEQITDTITRWAATAGNRPLEAAFFGGTFTALPEAVQAELLEPLQPFLAIGLLTSIRLSTRPDYVQDDQLAWLYSKGVRTIELGVQSFDDAILAASGRGHSAVDASTAIERVKRAGIRVGVQLMPGLPGDTQATSLASLDRAIVAGADFLRIYPVVVLKGTELARRFIAGEYEPLTLQQGVSMCKTLLQRALCADVPVIRIGLQADQSLDDQHILAGCWHPAFGQLVRSQLYADLIDTVVTDGTAVVIRCHTSRYSDVAGMKRSNLTALSQRGVSAQLFVDTTIRPDQLVIQAQQLHKTCSIITDLHYSIT
jgi:histone acetyltransferase (RNA polymerase elongator complex component)